MNRLFISISNCANTICPCSITLVDEITEPYHLHGVSEAGPAIYL